jgi:hypothetical protein
MSKRDFGLLCTQCDKIGKTAAQLRSSKAELTDQQRIRLEADLEMAIQACQGCQRGNTVFDWEKPYFAQIQQSLAETLVWISFLNQWRKALDLTILEILHNRQMSAADPFVKVKQMFNEMKAIETAQAIDNGLAFGEQYGGISAADRKRATATASFLRSLHGGGGSSLSKFANELSGNALDLPPVPQTRVSTKTAVAMLKPG